MSLHFDVQVRQMQIFLRVKPSPAQHFAEANHMVSQYTEIKGMNITTSIDSYDTTPGKNDRVEFSRGITADQPYRQ